jgi:hypothetical protein
MSLAYAGPFAFDGGFGAGFLPIATSDAVIPANDPSCTTYEFWVTPTDTFGVGTVTDTLTVTDSKGSTASVTITVVITQGA